MVKLRSLAPVLVAACTAAACAQSMESTGTTPSGSMMSNAQIADIAMTANSGEIQEAQLAVSKSSSSDVRSFAQRMIADHSSALRQMSSTNTAPAGQLDMARMNALTDGGAPTAGTMPAPIYQPMSGDDIAQQLAAGTQQTLQSLSPRTGRDFDMAYMQHQVAMHQWLLDTLDNSLIPSARSSTLRTQLVQQRAQVAQHLQLARQIAAQ